MHPDLQCAASNTWITKILTKATFASTTAATTTLRARCVVARAKGALSFASRRRKETAPFKLRLTALIC